MSPYELLYLLYMLKFALLFFDESSQNIIAVLHYRQEANDLLAKASEVTSALNKTDEAQKDAKEAINNVLNDVKVVNELISTVCFLNFSLQYLLIIFILAI